MFQIMIFTYSTLSAVKFNGFFKKFKVKFNSKKVKFNGKKWSSTPKSEVQHQKVKFNTKKSEVQHLYKIGVKLIVRNSIFYTIPESLM